MPRNNKKKHATTKHEQDRESKLLAGALAEELDATGQESETKAVKWVQEVGAEEKKKEDQETADALEVLSGSRKKIFTYRDALLQEMKRQMVESFGVLPENFLWYPIKDKQQGLLLFVRDPKGKYYARGMTICGNPLYDLNCVERLIQKALDHMDQLDDTFKAEAGVKQKVAV